MSARLDEALAVLEETRRERASAPIPLFGPPAELALVDDAIERVGRHVSNQWRRAALDAVRAAASVLHELTVEDVAWPGDIEPYDDRSRGAVMRSAARAGLIVSTQAYRPSVRPEAHRRPLLVWRSRLVHQTDDCCSGTQKAGTQ